MLAARPPRIVIATRIGHGLVSAVCLGCIVALYVAAWRGRIDVAAYVVLAALGLACALVVQPRCLPARA